MLRPLRGRLRGSVHSPAAGTATRHAAVEHSWTASPSGLYIHKILFTLKILQHSMTSERSHHTNSLLCLARPLQRYSYFPYFPIRQRTFGRRAPRVACGAVGHRRLKIIEVTDSPDCYGCTEGVTSVISVSSSHLVTSSTLNSIGFNVPSTSSGLIVKI